VLVATPLKVEISPELPSPIRDIFFLKEYALACDLIRYDGTIFYLVSVRFLLPDMTANSFAKADYILDIVNRDAW
jgi:hypothetical protein